MAGYMHLCRHCNQLIPPDSNACPYCGKKSPLGLRCPKCHAPLQQGWKVCPRCALKLEVKCPQCGELTFFGDYCDHCQAGLVVRCPKCKTEQPPVEDTCQKCGKPLAG